MKPTSTNLMADGLNPKSIGEKCNQGHRQGNKSNNDWRADVISLGAGDMVQSDTASSWPTKTSRQ